ncbi:MAG: metallophosphoesterase, partial [Chloroflexota bacterium]
MNNYQKDSTLKTRISRRDFIKITLLAGFGIISAGSFKLVSHLADADQIEVRKLKIRLPRLPAAFNGIRVAQISDIHLGGWMTIERMKKIFTGVKDQKPDLVTITGDFVQSSLWNRLPPGYVLALETELTELSSMSPTAAVLGNHDNWADPIKITELLLRSGVRILNNDIHRIQSGSEFIYMSGINDVYARENDLNQVLGKLTKKTCNILLAHEPDFADVSSATGFFDLQLSGHTHGGQVNIPFFGTPVLPYLGKKYP